MKADSPTFPVDKSPINSGSINWFSLIPVLALLSFSLPLRADPVRVTTWNLGTVTSNSSPASADDRLVEAAAALKKLNPDVILLQQIGSWQACAKLAEYLQPDTFQVLLCSSFKPAEAPGQVAILARQKALICWPETWKSADPKAPPGGFAFAVLRVGNKNVAFFSVQLGDGNWSSAGNRQAGAILGREDTIRQLLRQMDSFRDWTANRPDAFVIGGDFTTNPDDARFAQEKTLSLLEESGFANAFSGVPFKTRITVPRQGSRPAATLDYIFEQNAGYTTVQVSSGAPLNHHPVTCDLDPNSLRPFNPALAQGPGGFARPWYDNVSAAWSLVAAAVILLAVAIVISPWRRRSHPGLNNSALLTISTGSGTSISFPTGAERIVIGAPPALGNGTLPVVRVEMPEAASTEPEAGRPFSDAEAMRAGLLAHASRWLKERFVQKLISQRATLLETQQAAAVKALNVDQRLSRLETQIQQRNQVYEQRIIELTKELATAKEENRELIRAKITLLKAEMQREREKILRSAAAENGK